MKNKLSQIIFSFIAGASLAIGGHNQEATQSITEHSVLVDSAPKAQVTKLNPSQLKDILDLKLQGVEAYILHIENPSRRSYSVSTSSIEASVLDFETGSKILEKKGSLGVKMGLSAGGMFFWPLGVAGNIYSLFTAKKGKIFEGKLKAMLLDKAVVVSYSELNRLILVKEGTSLVDVKMDLIDMQTFKSVSVEITT